MPDGEGSPGPPKRLPKSGTFHSLKQGENFAIWLVDNSVTPRLYSPHNGAPVGFGAMARLRSTSLIVVTRLPISFGRFGLRRLSGSFGEGGSLGVSGLFDN